MLARVSLIRAIVSTIATKDGSEVYTTDAKTYLNSLDAELEPLIRMGESYYRCGSSTSVSLESYENSPVTAPPCCKVVRTLTFHNPSYYLIRYENQASSR